MNDQQDLQTILSSRFPIVTIETHEEQRVLNLLERICLLEEWPLFTWDAVSGLERAGPERSEFRPTGRRGHDPANFDLERIAEATESFSGAELEQAVVASLYEAYNDGQPLATEHLPNEAAATQPLSVVMAERLAGLRAWGADRAVMAH